LLARKTGYSLANGYEDPWLCPIITKAIEQARPARLHIPEKMIEAIEKPRTEFTLPRFAMIIDPTTDDH